MDEVIANIRSAVISTKDSTSLQQLQKDYRELVGELIPFKNFGFSSLESFLKTVPSLKLSRLPNGLTVVDAVATDNVKHIVNLVSKQKNSKKRASYVASKYRPNFNKSPGYMRPVTSPGYPRPNFVKPRYSEPYKKFHYQKSHYKPKDFKYVPKPVGSRRRLSVFDRLGPKVESSEDNFSTFDEEEDDFSAHSSRKVAKLPTNSRMSTPANVENAEIFLKKTRIEDAFISKAVESSSSDEWSDATSVLDISKSMSRLSLMCERIKSCSSEGRLSMPAHSSNGVCNINLPHSNHNDLDRPRMRTQQNYPSTSGATRPRPSFIIPPIIRPSVPRFDQNWFISTVRLPWDDKDKKVITAESIVDHHVKKDLLKPEEEKIKEFVVRIPMYLEKYILDAEDEEDTSKQVEVSKMELKPKEKTDSIKRWSDLPSNILPTCRTDDESVFDLEAQIPEPEESKIPKWSDIPRLNSFVDIKISHVVDPSCFYVQPFSNSAILDSMMERIQEKYSQNPIYCTSDDVILNEYYAFKHDDNFWYRVKITHFISPAEVNLFFCDFGYEIKSFASKLAILDPQFFNVPYQIFQAKMTGIRPNLKMWSFKDTTYFSDRVLGKSFVSLVYSVDKRREVVLGLKLFDTAGDNDVNIGKEMIENYIAQIDLDV